MINKKIYNTLPVFKKSNKKYQTAGKVTLTDAQKKIIEEGNKKRILDAANMEIEYTPGTAPSVKSTTTPVPTAPISNKTVVRLDDGSTNDYYEVDVDANGKPIFSTKKKNYSDSGKYYFDESPAATTNVPTLAVPASVTPKIANTGIASENKPPVKKVAQESKPKGSREVMALQKKLNDTYGANISVDGLIGNQTRKAFYNANLSEEERQKYLSANPKLNKTAAFGIPSYLTYLPSISETAPATEK